MWGFDLEAEAWDRVTCGAFVSDQGDVEVFQGEHPTVIEQVADFQQKTKGTHVAHAAGIYDTLLVSQAREEPWDEVVMSGSAVLCAKAGSLRVRDSFRWWLASLKKVGQYLEQLDDEREARGEPRRGHKGEWLKKEVDRKRIHLLTPEENRAYCVSDTRIVVEGVCAAQEYLEKRGARRAWTAGASALAMLQALEPASVGLLRRLALRFEDAVGAAECVRGARVETWALGRVPVVYSYDFKSAYPSAYMSKPIGIGARHLQHGDDDGAPGSVWRCRWFWPWRDKIPPVLDQRTGAGAGWCEAWCIPEELELLESFVGVQRIEGWAPETMAPIGQVFGRELFAEKERGSFFAKVFLNSLHGKFSESPVKEAWTLAKPDDYYGPAPVKVGDYWRCLQATVDKRGKTPAHLQPIAAAHILGRTRVKLWKAIDFLVRAGWEVYYCDTDSVHTNCPPDRMPFATGTGLGWLAFEGGPFEGWYLGPKAYALCDPSTGQAVKGACKGVPWGGLKDGVREGTTLYGHTYREARGEEKGEDLRVELFREALRDVGGAKVKKEGIATWAQGLRLRQGWQRYSVTRTIAPHERGKTFAESELPNVWAYQSPAELLAKRGAGSLALDPWESDDHPAPEIDDFFQTG